MARTDVETRFKTSYDGSGTQQFKRGIEGVGSAAETTGKKSQKAAEGVGSLQGLFVKLAAGGFALAAARQLIGFGVAAIGAASDVAEMRSKFNTVFGDQAGSVTTQLENFADAANRSIYDLQGFAATLQDTFVPLGFARDEAAKTSVEVVQLAEDLASFNNLNTADVVRDLQSALVGNTETLRKYGVVASQAAIEQHAINTGLWDGKGAIDAQTKAAAILQITYASTTDAQGDAIRTADGFANSSRGLQATLKELQVSIGNELLPVVTPLIAAFTDAAQDAGPELVKMVQDDMAPAFKDLADILGATMGLGPLLAAMNSDKMDKIIEVIKWISFAKVGEWVREGAAGLANISSESEEAITLWRENIKQTQNYGAELDRLRRMSQRATQAERDDYFELLQSTLINKEAAQGYEDQAYAMREHELARQRNVAALEDEAAAIEASNALYAANRQRLAEVTDLVQGFFIKALSEANSEQALYVVRSGEVVVNSKALGGAIAEAGAAAGLSAAELALISDEFLRLPEAQQEAILKSVIFQAELEKLKQKLIDGEISASEFRDAALQAADDINTMNFDEANGEIDALEEKITGFINRPRAPIRIQVITDLPDGNVQIDTTTGGQTTTRMTKQFGGPVAAGQPYLVHKDEIFIPNTSGQILNPGQQRTAGGLGGLTIGTITINLANPIGGSPREVATLAAEEIGRRWTRG